jgi:hypothetical protein
VGRGGFEGGQVVRWDIDQSEVNNQLGGVHSAQSSKTYMDASMPHDSPGFLGDAPKAQSYPEAAAAPREAK